MTFIDNILTRLQSSKDSPVLQEVIDAKIVPVIHAELADRISRARNYFRNAGLKKGDRCALIAGNSINWVAVDLALIAEGIIVVPLYSRQAVNELVGMMKDCGASLICCGDEVLKKSVAEEWKDAPRICLFDEVLASSSDASDASKVADQDPVAIIYTSGTSGEPKGVVLTAANVTYMLSCTNARLDLLMGNGQSTPDRVYHYLPFCFAGSWITLLSCLTRSSVLTMTTDLNKIADDMKLAEPDYFLNVPALLERVKRGIRRADRGEGWSCPIAVRSG